MRSDINVIMTHENQNIDVVYEGMVQREFIASSPSWVVTASEGQYTQLLLKSWRGI